MKTLSTRRQQILDFITRFIEEKDYSPSVRDIVGGCSISSASVAQYHLNVLEREGYIRRDREVSRSIGLLRKTADLSIVPLLGSIAAGQPIPVPSADTWEMTPEATLEIPRYLIGGLEKVYGLKVKGSSMIDALIDDGDIVLMQYTSAAENGEMVAVWLKDKQEVTLKKIYRESGKIRLQPANRTMSPIYVAPDKIEVQGKVIAMLRKVK